MQKNIFVSLIDSKIDERQLFDFVLDPECGAISSFLGITRNNFKGKNVLQLEYESYEKMALKKMEEIAEQAISKWPGVRKVAITHRLGIVPVMEASIFIAVSSEHRKDSLEAVQWLIDVLKAIVPVWKKEYYEDGSVWKENCECHSFKSLKDLA